MLSIIKIIAYILDINYANVLHDFLKQNHWLNGNQNSHTSRVVYPIRHDRLSFLMKVKYHFFWYIGIFFYQNHCRQFVDLCIV